MKLVKFIVASGLLLLAGPAFAQSTATPVLPGLLVTSGCPAGYTACYVPYSNTNPLPVSATITPSGTQDTNLKQVNGATVNVGAGAAGTGTQRVTTSTDSTIGTVTNPVGVKGADGTTISSTANPFNDIPQDSHATQLDFTTPALAILTSQYPNGSTPVGGPASGTTGAVVGSLPAVSAKTNFICGFTVSALGGVASIGPIVVAGLKGGSQTYQLVSTATGVTLPNPFAGSVCFPASGTNVAITVTTTADGTASAVNVNLWGYTL